MSRSEAYIPSIDALRVFAILAVIWLHTGPFVPVEFPGNPSLSQVAGMVLDGLALFAVPYFFMASGFLFGRSHRDGKRLGPVLGRLLLRIGTVYLVWNAAYLLLPFLPCLVGLGGCGTVLPSLGKSLASIAGHPVRFLLNGASYQLWFLPSLCQAAVIVFVFVRMGLRRWLIPCTLALFVVGLLGQGYSKLPFGLHLNTRTGPFFGSFLFALGFAMASRDAWTRVRPWQLILSGYGLIALEMAILYHWAGVRWVAHYYAGSVLVAAGFLLLATSRPGLLANSFLPRLGRLTLGVYVTHVILLNLAEDEFLIDLFRDSAVLALAYPVLVYACSLLLVLGLLRVPLLRRWVV